MSHYSNMYREATKGDLISYINPQSIFSFFKEGISSTAKKYTSYAGKNNLFNKLPFTKNNKRTIDDLYKMSDKLNYDLDMSSSLSQKGFLRTAKQQLGGGSVDYQLLPGLMNEYSRRNDENNSMIFNDQSRYNGRYSGYNGKYQ